MVLMMVVVRMSSALSKLQDWIEYKSRCTNPRHGYLVNRNSQPRAFVRVGCDNWRCPGCGPRKARKVKDRFLLTRPNWFVTFTLVGERGEATWENETWAKGAIRTFVNWMRRQRWVKFGREKFTIAWVRELGELHNRLHFHALFHIDPRVQRLPFSTMQRIAHGLGLGSLHITRIWRDEGAAHYAAKYLTKSLNDGADELGLRGRRFAMSPGHQLPSNPDWEFERNNPVGFPWFEPLNHEPYWHILVAEVLAGPRAPCSAVWGVKLIDPRTDPPVSLFTG